MSVSGWCLDGPVRIMGYGCGKQLVVLVIHLSGSQLRRFVVAILSV